MEDYGTIEAVRKRPGMYVGSVELFGFIHYLGCPIAGLLEGRPTRLAVTVEADGFVVESNRALLLKELADGRIEPFESFPDGPPGQGFDALVLNALSERLAVEVREGRRLESLEFRRGVRLSCEATTRQSQVPGTTLRFAPDSSIFTVTSLAPALFRSYLRRLSFLHPGVRFSFTDDGGTEEYHAPGGIVDLFVAVSSPCQIAHEPIHLKAADGDLALEAVFAYQSATGDALWCFINNGRAVRGGTHEQGLTDALARLHRDFKLPKTRKADRNGVVGVVSIHYPEVFWEGAIKARVSNPELRQMVSQLVIREASRWVRDRPDVAEQLTQLQTFRFPEVW